MSRKSWWLDSAAVFALASILVLPLFRMEYLNNWKSIEGAFFADERSLQENWPHHLWQPLCYDGTRANYWYPPGLRYGVAFISTVARVSIPRGYHLLIGFSYAFGFVVLYLWTRIATRSRGTAWFAAISIAVASPCFLLLPEKRHDSIFYVTQRLHVLMTYGEGPHISSLAMLPLSWLGAWKRFHGGNARWLCLSAIGIALTVTINFYGLTAVAMTMPLLVLACFLERPDWRIVRDAALIAVLSWALTAWWLTPSYVQVTARNLHLVQPVENSWSRPVLAVLAIAFLGVSVALRRRVSAYSFFIWSGALWFSVYILGYAWFGFQVAGDSQRMVPEMDLFLTLCLVQLAVLIWRWNPSEEAWLRLAARVALVVMLIFAFRPSWRYLKHVYSEFPEDRDWQHRVEYKTESWLYEHFPDERVFVTGTIRLWLDNWHDVQEADGGAQQGMENPLLPGAQWLVMHSNDASVMRSWLQALGVDVLVIPGKDSQEPYKDVEDPKKYDAFLPLLRDDGEGNRYYRVPRGATGIARVVDQARMSAIPQVRWEGLATQIQAYAAAIESRPGADRAHARWRGSDALDVSTELNDGEELLVQETYDIGWHACENGRALPIRADAVGHMLIALPPGPHTIRMAFEAPAEIVAGRIAAIGAMLLIGFLMIRTKAMAYTELS
jgi:hypothetical protein